MNNGMQRKLEKKKDAIKMEFSYKKKENSIFKIIQVVALGH